MTNEDAVSPRPAHPISARFEAAVTYAIDHHRDHLRKGTRIPYTAHLFAVTAIALEMECSEDEAIAALLHDVIEDGGGVEAEEEIRRRFGDDVAAMVRANSDADVEPKPPWRDRKVAYIEAIPAKPIGAVRVSIADKLHTARSILLDHRRFGGALWDRFSVSDPNQICWYYRSLVTAFNSRHDELGPGATAALDELDLTVASIERRLAA